MAPSLLCRILTFLPTLVTPWHLNPISIVERIDVENFDPYHYYRSSTSKPLLISNVLSPSECEEYAETLISKSLDLPVDLQNQCIDEKRVEVYDLPLSEALDTILYDSNSQDAYMAFCEGLLEEVDGLQDLNEKLTTAKESLFPEDFDWFKKHFPKELQPSDAVIISGAGATSTLHRDPYEWMGTSLCIEGSKVWRFIDPKSNVNQIDNALESYRLESIAWEGSPLSAGWQSDLSLYDSRQHQHILTAREWSEREEILTQDQKRKELQGVACSMDLLSPSNIEPFHSLSISAAIQEAGDLLLIPAHWWHQTYGLEPSAVIASQRCGKNECKQVLQHMLNRNHVFTPTAETILNEKTNPSEALDEVFHLLGHSELV